MDGKKNEKNRWMVGWIKKKKRWMVGWIKKWLDEKNMDGWMDKKKKKN